jgi:hypothetical protein
MKYKLNKIALALSLIPFALNATADTTTATNNSQVMYQSELDQLELVALVEAPVATSSTAEVLYWMKSTANAETGLPLFSCTLTNTQTPYLVTQQNSFEACIVNNFNIDIIDDQINMADLPKLSIDTSPELARSMTVENSDDTVISEYLISWQTPQHQSADVPFEEMLAQGFVIELPSRGEILINNIRIYPSDSGFSVQGKVEGYEY